MSPPLDQNALLEAAGLSAEDIQSMLATETVELEVSVQRQALFRSVHTLMQQWFLQLEEDDNLDIIPGAPSSLEDILTPGAPQLDYLCLSSLIEFWATGAKGMLEGSGGKVSVQSAIGKIDHLRSYLLHKTGQNLPTDTKLQLRRFVKDRLESVVVLRRQKLWADLEVYESLAKAALDSTCGLVSLRARMNFLLLQSIMMSESIRLGSILQPKRISDKRSLVWGDLTLSVLKNQDGQHNDLAISFVTPNAKNEASAGIRIVLVEREELWCDSVFWMLALAHEADAFPVSWTLEQLMDPRIFENMTDDYINVSFNRLKDNEAVFLGRPHTVNGTPPKFTVANLSHLARTVATAAGLSGKVTGHVYRRSGAICLKIKAVDQLRIQAQLTHALRLKPGATVHSYIGAIITPDVTSAVFEGAQATTQALAFHPDGIRMLNATQELPVEVRLLIESDPCLIERRAAAEQLTSELTSGGALRLLDLSADNLRKIRRAFGFAKSRRDTLEQYFTQKLLAASVSGISLPALAKDAADNVPNAGQEDADDPMTEHLGNEERGTVQSDSESEEEDEAAWQDDEQQDVQQALHLPRPGLTTPVDGDFALDPSLEHEGRQDASILDPRFGGRNTGTLNPLNSTRNMMFPEPEETPRDRVALFSAIVTISDAKVALLGYRSGEHPINNVCRFCGEDIDATIESKTGQISSEQRVNHVERCAAVHVRDQHASELREYAFLAPSGFVKPMTSLTPESASMLTLGHTLYKTFEKGGQGFKKNGYMTCLLCEDVRLIHHHQVRSHVIAVHGFYYTNRIMKLKGAVPQSMSEVDLDQFPLPVYYNHLGRHVWDPRAIELEAEKFYNLRIISNAPSSLSLRSDVVIPVDCFAEDERDGPDDARYQGNYGHGGRFIIQPFCFFCVNDPRLTWSERAPAYSTRVSYSNHVMSCHRSAVQELMQNLCNDSKIHTLHGQSPFFCDGRIICPDPICSNGARSFDDILELVRHLAAMHQVSITSKSGGDNSRDKKVKHLDNLSFRTHEELCDWLLNNRTRRAGRGDARRRVTDQYLAMILGQSGLPEDADQNGYPEAGPSGTSHMPLTVEEDHGLRAQDEIEPGETEYTARPARRRRLA